MLTGGFRCMMQKPGGKQIYNFFAVYETDASVHGSCCYGLSDFKLKMWSVFTKHSTQNF